MGLTHAARGRRLTMAASARHTASLHATLMDGNLWGVHRRFAHAQSTTRQQQPDDDQRFRLGTGFSDADRAQPPPVGAWVTYRFRGTHDGGLPRFASYLRVREDMPAR